MIWSGASHLKKIDSVDQKNFHTLTYESLLRKKKYGTHFLKTIAEHGCLPSK